MRGEVIDRNEQAESNPQYDPGQSHCVGKQLGLRIGEDQSEQQIAEHNTFQRRQRESEMQVAAKKQQACEHFDDKVARRNALLAGAAFSAKHQPTDDRKIVVQRNHVSAVRTRRAWRYHRLAPRQPVDAHVQEAAKAQPVGEDRYCKKNFHVG